MGAPLTSVDICSGVRLTPEYTHTILFSTPHEQWAYFAGKCVKSYTKYTYVRKSWSLKVDATMEQARTWSYMFFTNGGKIWYYFITDIEYINDNTVELFLEMDVMQSYMFDYTLLECLVEREHSASDEVGSNLIDEGLEMGEYVAIDDHNVDLNDYHVMILATANPAIAADDASELVPELGTKMGNVFSGLSIYAVKLGDSSQLKTLLNKLDTNGVTDMIIAMWMYPAELLTLGTPKESWAPIIEVSSAKSVTETVSRNTVLANGYIPRNKKLFTSPFNFLYVTNNAGEGVAYPYEQFGDPAEPVFNIVGAVSPDCTVRMYPINYRGTQHNFECGITLGNFPTCAWDSDIYKMWLAQNQNQHQQGLISGWNKAVASAALASMGGPMGIAAGAVTLYSAYNDVMMLQAQKRDMSIKPDEARGQFSSTVSMTAGFQTFTIRKKCVSYLDAKRLDEYFDMFGYKTLRVKKPNREARRHWTFTKTVGCQIAGIESEEENRTFDICTADKMKIESIYNNGITFWKNGDRIGDYSAAIENTCTGVEG